MSSKQKIHLAWSVVTTALVAVVLAGVIRQGQKHGFQFTQNTTIFFTLLFFTVCGVMGKAAYHFNYGLRELNQDRPPYLLLAICSMMEALLGAWVFIGTMNGGHGGGLLSNLAPLIGDFGQDVVWFSYAALTIAGTGQIPYYLKRALTR